MNNKEENTCLSWDQIILPIIPGIKFQFCERGLGIINLTNFEWEDGIYDTYPEFCNYVIELSDLQSCLEYDSIHSYPVFCNIIKDKITISPMRTIIESSTNYHIIYNIYKIDNNRYKLSLNLSYETDDKSEIIEDFVISNYSQFDKFICAFIEIEILKFMSVKNINLSQNMEEDARKHAWKILKRNFCL